MTLCRLMQMDFKGELEGISPEDAYSIENLLFGIRYCDGWMSEGKTQDCIGNFNLQDFKDWCVKKLRERATQQEMLKLLEGE